MRKRDNDLQVVVETFPVGRVVVAGTEDRVKGISLVPEASRVDAWLGERYPGASRGQAGAVAEALGQLREYFRGQRRTFDLPLGFEFFPPFTARVLLSLAEVPFGETLTYGQLASRAGNSRAARAVGRAMAANPYPIVIPCHRVLGAGGKMTGYSGGSGVATKKWLLEFEREMVAEM